MENRFYVYALLDPRKPGNYQYDKYHFDYEPFYIGKGTKNRAQTHLSKYEIKKGFNPYKNSKITNIRKENLEPKILIIKDKMNENQSFQMEKHAIKHIGRKESKGPLTNLYDGGYGSSKSQETRNKISATKKMMYKTGQLIHPMLGKKLSAETIKKIKDYNKLHPRKWTKKQKAKLKIIRCKIKPNNTTNWKIISPKGEEYTAWGLGEFCRNHDLCQCHMFEVSKGTRKHHKGWTCQKII